ncbi:MAG: phosphoribosylformylglycinamidine synthase subunit PurQ [Deltaproteobacteria bacterium]|nr:phosphoribosylformylglycinamidine synthase subunit PurQ [Candidatus Zymogenaceae bacterium]
MAQNGTPKTKRTNGANSHNRKETQALAPQVRVMTLSGNGINCERETAHAFSLAGASVSDIVHVSRVVCGEVSLNNYHILALPGGFLDGDDLGAGKAMANRLKFASVADGEKRLIDMIMSFIADGKLILGICNGFQLMVKTGLLPGLGGDYTRQTATITYNDSGRFDDRWVRLSVDESSPSVFTKGLTDAYFPIRHGEGKFVAPDDVLDALEEKHLVTLRYADEDYDPTMQYPQNPNGSLRSIAGICDETGRLMAMMPHPEAHIHKTQHPRWTRQDRADTGPGLVIFKNAVEYVVQHLL